MLDQEDIFWYVEPINESAILAVHEHLDLIERLRTRDPRTPRQSRMIALWDDPCPSAEDRELLTCMIRAETTREAARAAAQTLHKANSQYAYRKRRLKVKTLIELGDLIVVSKVSNFDRATIIGALLELHNVDGKQLENWKSLGELILKKLDKTGT